MDGVRRFVVGDEQIGGEMEKEKRREVAKEHEQGGGGGGR